MRGRVSAVNGTFIGASNELGEFRAGTVAEWLGPVGAVIVGGVGTLIVAGLWIGGFRRSRGATGCGPSRRASANDRAARRTTAQTECR